MRVGTGMTRLAIQIGANAFSGEDVEEVQAGGECRHRQRGDARRGGVVVLAQVAIAPPLLAPPPVAKAGPVPADPGVRRARALLLEPGRLSRREAGLRRIQD
jgi:hypothetical protein